ncbi:zinc finger CCCH domain-containing protein 58-like [Andrographis paniculata]|uniref:zinc finger CCCH domain-containing protein 58-like n=1 Tax=Andrographis paniculata TaxID=175694 RepID=UPI0021E99C33|nr:zinc finger CCCH domain-containing protein 58-like [Andrographis paniculata]
MDKRGETTAAEAVPAEWASPSGETGLEESVRQLGLGGGGYPERSGEPDCIYYVRTGFCGYGNRCRFNHPPDCTAAIGAFRASGDEYPERTDQPVCKYYMRTGLCKYGASCKYHHPKQGGGAFSVASALNVLGYPLRPGEDECAYFNKTGKCKFGITCKFHHPQPAIYSPENYHLFVLPPPVLPIRSWSSYQAPISRIVLPRTRTTSASIRLAGTYQTEHTFPERPGEPECRFYLRTGSCKFGSGCKYHHPPMSSDLMQSSTPVCSRFAENGFCRFGPSCKYDHLVGIFQTNS